MSVAKDVLKTGDVIEVCGFTLKATPNLQARVMNGHVLVMPDGKKRFWSNYGLLDKCLGPGESDSLIR
jgi:hypothetical protein